MHVQVPTNVIRNEDIFITNEEFVLYVRLCLLYFKNYKDEQIKVDHKKLMGKLKIGDSRTLKQRLNSLYKNKLILNEVEKLPRKGEMVIQFNGKVIDESKHFTKMDVKIFDYVEKINPHSFRLIFYYKSHINMKEDRRLNFCFVGTETLKERLKMGGHTIKTANDLLVENKLIKVVRHKIENTYSFNEDDELIFDRYNNHYFVNEKLF